MDKRALTARDNWQRKFADYVLFHKPNLPLAVIEAKDANHSVSDGMQQALGYAEMSERFNSGRGTC